MIIPLRLCARTGAERRDFMQTAGSELRFVLFSNSLGY